MPLEPIVEDINQLDESLRPFYKESEAGFILDVQPKNGYELDNVSGLKSALSKERQTRASLESKMSKFSSLGDYDPEEITHKLSRLEELESLDPTKEADKIAEAKLKSLQEQMSKKHLTEVEKLSGTANKYKGQLQKMLIEDAAKNAILASGGDERTIAFMLDKVTKQLSLQENENGFITQVVDGEGLPQIGDVSGSPMTVQQLVERMKGDDLWGSAFPGRNKSGGGRPSDGNGGTPGKGLKRSDMSALEKSDFVSKHGRAAFNKLPK